MGFIGRITGIFGNEGNFSNRGNFGRVGNLGKNFGSLINTHGII